GCPVSFSTAGFQLVTIPSASVMTPSWQERMVASARMALLCGISEVAPPNDAIWPLPSLIALSNRPIVRATAMPYCRRHRRTIAPRLCRRSGHAETLLAPSLVDCGASTIDLSSPIDPAEVPKMEAKSANGASKPIKPAKFAHAVLRTNKFNEMVEWY